MNSLENSGHMQDPTLMEELLSKLPAALQLQWCMVRGEDDGLKKFADWMMQLALAASSMPNTPDDVVFDFDSNTKYPGTRQQGTKVPCPKCYSGDHGLSKCHAFLATTMDERWNLITSRSLCISCLNGGHQSMKCAKRKQCGVAGCTKPHHPLLHRMNSTNQ